MIALKPYKERTKRKDYSHRGGQCEAIDAALQKNLRSFDEQLKGLQTQGHEIKYSKRISVKGKNQA